MPNTKIPSPFYFPSISEYSTLLESHSFKISYALLFERPTLLDGQNGLRNFAKVFRQDVLTQIAEDKHESYFQLLDKIGTNQLKKDGDWYADYLRIRMVATFNR